MHPDLEKKKYGPAESGVSETILKRWSPRAFASKPVAKADLKKIFTAAGWAASSYNEQPWRYLVGIKGDAKAGETWEKILHSLGEFNQIWAKNAPVLIASLAKKTFSHNGSPNGTAQHDLGAASASLCLQAIELGIHTHGMGGFDRNTLRASFGIPEDFEPVAVWAMGYLGDPEALPEHYKAQELAPRTRKTLDQYVLTNWDEEADFED